MQPKKRQLHELLDTEIIKSRTIKDSTLVEHLRSISAFAGSLFLILHSNFF